MTIELRPLGVKCNIQCQYCYQNPQRDAGNVLHTYDLDKMMAAIADSGQPFTLFGGEPLLLPLPDLERLWAWGYEKFGHNGTQTNATLIQDTHLALFKKYKVHVGVSVDGPGELNDARWAGSLQRTREATAKTEDVIATLIRENIPMSLIVTLHRANATGVKLPRLLDWFRELDRLGVQSARLHILEVENALIQKKYALTPEENLDALLQFMTLEKEMATLKLDTFRDMRLLLQGKDESVTCVWNACDPYTTRAVRGLEGNGQASNCGRTNKDGIDFVKADQEGFERYLALYYTPQEFYGCRDCRFFMMCKGQCPGTAVNGDWRNRTEHCQVWMSLYEHLETELLTTDETDTSLTEPVEMSEAVVISQHPERAKLEAFMLESWLQNRYVNIATTLSRLNGERKKPENAVTTSHGDYTDHGDSAHGDEHGDHTDFGGVES